MRDLLPAGMRAFRRVEDSFRSAASCWGYEEVRTPTIETYRLFTAAGALTPQMLSRVYSFLDWDGWSGERVVLRPDSTIPVARAATEAQLPLPTRLFYVQNVFRFSESDDREDWQCGIEFLGAPETIGELEVAAVACESLDALGLAPEVRVSHIGVARALVAALGGDDQTERGLYDRVANEGLGALRQALASHARLAALVDVALRPGSVALLDNLDALASGDLPAATSAIRELRSVASALAESGRTVVVDLGLPRDFEYYSGVVFEFTSGGQSWGGGGRYRPAGPGTPDTACGMGLEAKQLAEHISGTTGEPLVVAIIPAAPSALARSLAVARALHRGGVAAALGGPTDGPPLSVTVSRDQLIAHTPNGDRAMSALDDVVGLLLQFK